nr:MAG TPA: hypothetical protein [Caudoviricetes sp.]
MRKEVINDLRNAMIGFGEILDYAIDEKNSRCNVLIIRGSEYLRNSSIYAYDEVNAELYVSMVYFNSLKGIDTIVINTNKIGEGLFSKDTINGLVEALDPILEKEVGHKHHFHMFDRNKKDITEKVTFFEKLSKYFDFEIEANRLALRDKIIMMYVYNNLCKVIGKDEYYRDATLREFHYWTNEKRYNYTKSKFEKMLTSK